MDILRLSYRPLRSARWGWLLLAVALVACAPDQKSEPEAEELNEGNGAPGPRPVHTLGGLPSSTTVPSPSGQAGDAGAAEQPELPDGSIGVAADAAAGCRAPDEPGCASCCNEDSVTVGCLISSGDTWYDDQEFQSGLCPIDCPPCARCSRRDEEQLRGLVVRPECGDCSADPGPNPCSAPGSCNCYCSTRLELVARCGELNP